MQPVDVVSALHHSAVVRSHGISLCWSCGNDETLTEVPTLTIVDTRNGSFLYGSSLTEMFRLV